MVGYASMDMVVRFVWHEYVESVWADGVSFFENKHHPLTADCASGIHLSHINHHQENWYHS
jgi:hypothetical protein